MRKAVNLFDVLWAALESPADLSVALAQGAQPQHRPFLGRREPPGRRSGSRNVGPLDDPSHMGRASVDPPGNLVDVDAFVPHGEHTSLYRPKMLPLAHESLPCRCANGSGPTECVDTRKRRRFERDPPTRSVEPWSGAGIGRNLDCYDRPVTTDTHETLRSVPLFAALEDAALAQIAAVGTDFECAPSYVLTERGHPGTGLFIIDEGTVSVQLPSGGTLELGPGDFVGELALLTNTPRTARVSCTSDVRGLAIGRVDFAELLIREPTIALSMLSELARRLTENAKPYGTAPTEPRRPL